MYFYRIILLSLFVVIIVSCSKSKPVENQPIQFKMAEESREYGDCSDNDASCAKISAEYPELSNPGSDSLVLMIQNKIYVMIKKPVIGEEEFESFEEMAKHFLTEYQNFKREFPDSPQSWEVDRDVKVSFNKNSIFSFEFEEFSFTGGAHPNTTYSYFNYDLVSGHQIQLNELFGKSAYTKILEIAERTFREKYEIDPSRSLDDEGYWFKNNRFYLPENFLITDKYLTFLFNSYEVAPYSMGEIKFEIPFAEVKDLIENESLLAKIYSSTF